MNTKWIQTGITVAGRNGQGNELNQLSNPWGMDIDDNQTIYVADRYNHRIVEWKSDATSGQVLAGENEEGNRNVQLNAPVNVTIDKENDSLIICDNGNKRVVRRSRRNGTTEETVILKIACWDLMIDNDGYLYIPNVNKQDVRRWKMGETNRTVVVAGGNGRGNRLDQLSQPYYIFVDQDHSVYVSDYDNHRVIKWMKGAKEGIAVAGGQGQGTSRTQLAGPRGLIVDQLGTVYVADENNHRLMRWPKGAREGSVVVGGNGSGEQANQLNDPMSLSCDKQNNLYVVDNGNHRVQKFNIEQNSSS
jgi:sugar lactone lactonase YvrE